MQHVAVLGGDEQVLAAACEGDQASFERLIEPHLAIGYRLAVAMLNDSGLAEDTLQESTLRAWRSIRHLRSSDRIRSWFLSIVANRCRSLRRASWWSVIRLSELRAGLPSPAEEVDRHEDLSRAFDRLSAEDRAAVYLRFYEEFSSAEVGAALRIPPAAARMRIHRALRRMRVDLAEEDL